MKAKTRQKNSLNIYEVTFVTISKDALRTKCSTLVAAETGKKAVAKTKNYFGQPYYKKLGLKAISFKANCIFNSN